MSDWKELPKPATPGPWDVCVLGDEVCYAVTDPDRPGFGIEHRLSMEQIESLPEYVAEVERLRTWVDIIDGGVGLSILADRIRAGEWPEGRRP